MSSLGSTVIDPFELAERKEIVDVTENAIWYTSSAKKCQVLSNLFDNSIETFWQSEGPQPHILTAHFRSLTPISAMSLYLDYKRDESYVPKKFAIFTGYSPDTLELFTTFDRDDEPAGWHVIPFYDKRCAVQESDITDPEFCLAYPMNTFCIQIRIIQLHQGGKDVLLRQLKLFARNKVNNQNVRDMNHFVKLGLLPCHLI